MLCNVLYCTDVGAVCANHLFLGKFKYVECALIGKVFLMMDRIKGIFGQEEKISVLIKLPLLPNKQIDLIIDIINGGLENFGRGVAEYVGITKMENLGCYYLEVKVPKSLFPTFKSVVSVAVPQAKRIFINETLTLEKPPTNQSALPLNKSIPIKIKPMLAANNREYLELPKIWEHVAMEAADYCLVAVVDTGISTEYGNESPPWLEDRLVAKRYFMAQGYPDVSQDYIGHGSHCTNLIGGGKNGEIDLRGVNQKALFAAAQIFNQSGSTTLGAIIAAWDWCAGLKVTYKNKEYRVRVMNNSFGSAGSSDGKDELSELADKLWAQGIYMEFSIGNEGGNQSPCDATVGSPAASFKTVKTGATTGVSNPSEGQSLTREFSSRPPTADGRSHPELRFLTAPDKFPGYDRRMSDKLGTSFSGPIHSGVASLLLSVKPKLTNEQVWETIKSTAWEMGYRNHPEKYTVKEADCLEGAGELKPYAAFLQVLGESPNPPAAKVEYVELMCGPVDGDYRSIGKGRIVDAQNNCMVSVGKFSEGSYTLKPMVKLDDGDKIFEGAFMIFNVSKLTIPPVDPPQPDHDVTATITYPTSGQVLEPNKDYIFAVKVVINK